MRYLYNQVQHWKMSVSRRTSWSSWYIFWPAHEIFVIAKFNILKYECQQRNSLEQLIYTLTSSWYICNNKIQHWKMSVSRRTSWSSWYIFWPAHEIFVIAKFNILKYECQQRNSLEQLIYILTSSWYICNNEIQHWKMSVSRRTSWSSWYIFWPAHEIFVIAKFNILKYECQQRNSLEQLIYILTSSWAICNNHVCIKPFICSYCYLVQEVTYICWPDSSSTY